MVLTWAYCRQLRSSIPGKTLTFHFLRLCGLVYRLLRGWSQQESLQGGSPLDYKVIFVIRHFWPLVCGRSHGWANGKIWVSSGRGALGSFWGREAETWSLAGWQLWWPDTEGMPWQSHVPIDSPQAGLVYHRVSPHTQNHPASHQMLLYCDTTDRT